MSNRDFYADADMGNLATKGPFAIPATATADVLSDTLDMTRVANGFMCLAAGIVKVRTGGNSGNTVSGGQHDVPLTVLAGVIYPIRIRRIWSTTTTVVSSNIVLLYDGM